MIITKLRGGLGNQMFQYAFGRTLALRDHTQHDLDLSTYSTNGNRRFDLDSFNASYGQLIQNNLVIKIRKLLGHYKTLTNVFFYHEPLTQVFGNLYLDGFWESPKYFSLATETIKKDFTLKNPSKAFLEHASAIPVKSIAVHVRRGDFLTSHEKVLNGKVYYDLAVSMIIKEKQIKKPNIVVFSDDPSWCKAELNSLAGQATVVFGAESLSPAENLILMSLYNHNVISNSTYSWWAAFLNKNPKKMVVAPERWLTDTDINQRYVQDILPPEWVIAREGQSR